MSAQLFCLAEEADDGDGDGMADSVLRVSADSFKTMLTSTSDTIERNNGLMFRDDGEDELNSGLAERDPLCGKSLIAAPSSGSGADAKLWLGSLLADGPSNGVKDWDPDDGRDGDRAAHGRREQHADGAVRPETPSGAAAAHAGGGGGSRSEHSSLLYQFEHDIDLAASGERKFFKVLTDDEIGGFGSAPGDTPAPGLMAHASGASSVVWGSASTLGLTRSTAGASTDLFPVPSSESGEQGAGGAADRLPPPSAPATAKKTPRMLKKSLPTLLTEMGTHHPLRILLVDDNPVILQSQSRQLEMLGYQCQLANNGKVALARLAGGPIDVMLLDLHMPEMDGFETADAIKRNYPQEVRPTIIAVTGSQSAEESLMCLSLGIKYYLAKPLGITDLATLLAKCQQIPAPEPKHVSTSKTLETPDKSASRQKTLPRKGSL